MEKEESMIKLPFKKGKEKIIFNEQNEKEFQNKIRANEKDIRREKIFRLFIPALVSFVFFPFFLNPFIHINIFFRILVLIGAFGLIYVWYLWHSDIINGYEKSIRPILITNKAIYLPTVNDPENDWEKIVFSDIKKIYWNKDLPYFMIVFDNHDKPVYKQLVWTKLKGILRKYSDFDVRHKMEL